MFSFSAPCFDLPSLRDEKELKGVQGEEKRGAMGSLPS